MNIRSEAKRPNFSTMLRMGAVSASMAIGLGVASPAASAQQLEMELLDMVGMGGVDVSGFVSLTNNVFWRGVSLTSKNGFGINGAIHAAIGNGGYLGFFGTNYGLGDTDGVFVTYGGYAPSFSLGDAGTIGVNVGMTYFYHHGSYDAAVLDAAAAGDRTRDSETRSFYEIHLAASYTEPFFNIASNFRIDFDYYHNGPNGNDPAPDFGDPYWAIHVSGGQSYSPSVLPNLSVGWFAGGYVQPLLDPTLVDGDSVLNWAYGGINASYNVGKGLSLGLRGSWNDIPVDVIPLIASGSGGDWSFTLTKSF